MIRPSELTSRVDIENPTATNTNGVVSESWASVATSEPASVQPRSSLTFTQAAQVQSQTTHVIRIRYRSGITSKTRLTIGSRVFHLVGPPRREPEARPTDLVFEVIEME